MSFLVLGADTAARVGKVVAFAEAHRFTLADVQNCVVTKKPMASDPLFSCFIPASYFCSYTIEEHPGAVCRHLSVSVNHDDRYAAPEALEQLMKLFGFTGGIDCADAFYSEKRGQRGAINIVQRYDYPSEA